MARTFFFGLFLKVVVSVVSLACSVGDNLSMNNLSLLALQFAFDGCLYCLEKSTNKDV
jgi:hypothetical protein